MPEWKVKRCKYVPSLAYGVAVLLVVGCHDAARDQEVASLHRQIAAQDKAVREAKKDAEVWRRIANEKYEYAERQRSRADELQARVDRVREIIGQNIERLTGDATAQHAQPQQTPSSQRSPSTTSATSTLSEYRQASSSKPQPTWNDVSKASDFFDAPRVIAAHCKKEWPSDPEMENYCGGKQQNAVSQLQQGRPFGADEKQWNEARVRCANEWPTDYAMRVYCEGKR